MTNAFVEVVGGTTATVDAVVSGTIATVDVVLHPSTDVEVTGGVPGPPGPPGPAGPPGSTGETYTHVQSVPEPIWTIVHPLTYQPNITVIDSAGDQVEGDVNYGPGMIVLTFSGAFSGTAYLS